MFSFKSLLLLASVVTASVLACDEGWSGYEEHCYKFFPDHKTWYAADDYCRRVLGANVASIHSSGENEFLHSLADVQAWIGFTDVNIEGKYVWSDGTASDYINWSYGEPNNFGKGEDCAIMYGEDLSYGVPGKWNDSYCVTIEIGFICKK